MEHRIGDLLRASATRHADRTAVEDPARGAQITYRELDSLSDRLRDVLAERGVGAGDRVGVSGKSIGTLATMFGALKLGAAYVPVDAAAPARRGAEIYTDCGVKAVAAAPPFASELAKVMGTAAPPATVPELAGWGGEVLLDGPGVREATVAEDLAYVLYTSGSTGKPKGVMHTDASALAFVDWCSREFRPVPEDRFSSHAPFHFDLSILDVFVPLFSGATLVLIGDELGKQPAGLAELIAERRISVWYSTPSILALLLEFGKLERHDFGALRLVLFAGEVFPIPKLRRLKQVWPGPRYCNLYGPTETNVCTWFDVPEHIPADRADPFPIGQACSGDRTRVVRDGVDVEAGAEGELLVAGESVMKGYWNLPERTAECFQVDPEGTRWYATGDVVRADERGDYVFLGRRDRMIKRRGYRIEPGEIEAALHRHPAVVEAAVVGIAGDEGATTIKAFLSCRGDQPPSLIELKRWCAENLPMYMVPDRFSFHDTLPKTSTDKIDYRSLAAGA